MTDVQRILVVGAGVFGVTAAIELRRRGHAVRLLDPGPLPHPLAASTDISKVVRLEYGADEAYTALAEEAIEGWRRWNRGFGEALYHQTGLLFLRQGPLSPGTLEQDSLEVLARRGHRADRLDVAAVRARFPAWNAERYPHGIYDPQGGFVESGRAIARLVERAREDGVDPLEGVAFKGLLHERPRVSPDSPGRVAGIVSSAGERIEAGLVVLALGAWTPFALPWMAAELRSTGQPVFHLAPEDPAPFRPERFPVFCADIQTTGYYGFPVHPVSGVVKIARHGPGRALHPESPRRAVTAEEIADLRAFLAVTFPRLQRAAIPYTRVCLYCDSWDGHFWIAHDPDRPGLVLATGDSGHAFKFAPVLGPLVADVVEGRSHPLQARFRWRPGLRPARSEEAARFQGS
jgi:glycine/D-amino acid oxidase-like deaminating enzyme